MRSFRVPLFEELERRDWWWSAGVLDRMVFLQLFKKACEDGGTVWVGVGLAPWVGADVDGSAVIQAYGRLVNAGALEDVSEPDERWRYRIAGFEALADAAHTARSRARSANLKWRRKREEGAA